MIRMLGLTLAVAIVSVACSRGTSFSIEIIAPSQESGTGTSSEGAVEVEHDAMPAPSKAPSEVAVEIRARGGEPPGLERHLVVKADGGATYTRNGFAMEAGRYRASLPGNLITKLAEAIDVLGEGEGPFPPDSVVLGYERGARAVDFGEAGGPAPLKSAQKAVIDQLLASPEWTVAVKVLRAGDGTAPNTQRVLVQLQNRGTKSVSMEHPAAKTEGRTPMETSVPLPSKGGSAEQSARRESIVLAGGPPPNTDLVLAPGKAVELALDVRMPSAKGIVVDVIYAGRALPEGAEPLGLSLDTRFQEPSGLR